ncbi:MAG: hypothetical protein JWQ81_6301 [Amycolatopsis sp.]|jgi:hypothetical protein|uniref:DUF4328 domain-containing protein n=1 Tax=Amycolatopsis sp. TaxID=37632 RepID=UPI0026348980|nr:DUF4328 domain-containing protein [Amycolatopsis sp.]MCU1685562.1 hypothetical protein [Amycolatopsis sp.]
MHPGQYPQARPQMPPQPRYAQPQPFQQPRYRTRVRWVASPPPGAWPARRAKGAERYAGPPSYAAIPRWGFPNLTWRSPTAVPGTASDVASPLQRVRMIARNTAPMLWILAVLGLVAGGSEIWRYVLLVQSRASALNTGVVATSDSLLLTSSLLTSVFSLVPVVLALWWLFVARVAAADAVGENPPRSSRQVLAGFLVPVVNLVMAGSIIAELEHAVLSRPSARRPSPSRLVLGWWAAWIVNWVLLVVVLWWRTQDGVQAQADGTVLTALLDLSAVALAVVTALLIRRFTGLLAPMDARKLRSFRVVKVDGAPDPALRAVRSHGGVR